MSQIQYYYLNTHTKLLVASDKQLCKEVGHCGLTWAIPFMNEDKDFCTLIAGGKKFTEKKAIKLFKKLTGIVIPEIK